jgi:hypothetical protein
MCRTLALSDDWAPDESTFRRQISTGLDEEQQDDKATAARIATSKEEDGTWVQEFGRR